MQDATAAASLLTLPTELFEAVLAELTGQSLVSLAKAVGRSEPAALATIKSEVERRECKVETALAKAKAAGQAVEEARRGWSARRGFFSPLLPLEALTEELCELNRLIGKHAAAGQVPLSDLVEGSLRTCEVAIIGSEHRPPPAVHVAGLVKQCVNVACGAARAFCGHKGWLDLAAAAAQERLYDLAGFVYWRLSWVHLADAEEAAM